MPWPSTTDYNAAVQSLPTCAGDEELRRGCVHTNALGLPVCFCGEFSVVFRIDCPATGHSWAVKCYTREVRGLCDRYATVAAHLRQVRLPSIVEYSWLDHGIRVAGQWYPCLKMPWLDGQFLGEFVSQHLDQSKTLNQLANLWWKLAIRMRTAQVAHPDLHPANVLLTPDPVTKRVTLKLIDYDALYVPALAGCPPQESGHPAFQHPRLSVERDYGPEIDRFAHLSVYCALRCLADGGRALWDLHGDQERLLLGHRDLAAPEQSAAFRSLWKLPDVEVRHLVGHLMLAAHGPPEDVPRLDELAPDGKVVPLSKGKRRQVERAVAAGTWPSEYRAEISIGTPTCVVIVVQQSGSPPGPGVPDISTPAATFAEWTNKIIGTLVMRCSGGAGTRDWFYLGLITYGARVVPGFRGDLAGQGLVSISQVASHPLRVANRSQSVFDDDTGEMIETSVSMLTWLDAEGLPDEGSSLCAALWQARDWVADFLKHHPDCYPPIVIHLGDGRATDGDPERDALALRQLASDDGAVLFFNACLSSRDSEGVLFPGDDRALPDDRARLLWRMSSLLCPPMMEEAHANGFRPNTSARGFSLNTNLEAVLRFYQLGTRVSRRLAEASPSTTAAAAKPLIFISAKSDDYHHARAYYEYLTIRGLDVFLSCESLPQLGVSDYREAIDQALDEAKHMIVITTSAEHVRSSWVKAEWGLFINEKRSDRKAGNLITVALGSLRIADLPASLRYYEVIPGGPESFEKVYNYVGH